ncbi:MAG: phosphoglucosamine mutase [Candidatus Odinarchaeia archaeon]
MPKLFGTTGVRGVFNNNFDATMALKLGEALGTYLNDGDVLIGRDTRTTAKIIEEALTAGLNSCGSNILKLGIVTTPTIAYLTKKFKSSAGVMVTASHNPPEYIGVKFWSNSGLGFTTFEESKIEEIYFSEEFNLKTWNKIGKISYLNNPADIHVEGIINNIDVDKIKMKNFKIALDVGCGAGYVIAPLLLKKLNCKIVSLNMQPDGYFPGRPSKPSPDTLKDLINLVKSGDFNLGIAFDGDADRVVFLDENGTVIPGDVLLASISRYLLKKKTGIIVTTLESSMVIEDIVNSLGGRLIWTPIGDINVGQVVKDEKALIGGEECGVYIWPNFHYGPDSFYTVGKILEILANENITLSEFTKGIKRYPVIRHTIDVDEEEKLQVMDEIENRIRMLDNITSIDKIDGLNVKFKDGRALIRPSGTEPVIRITVEAPEGKILSKLFKMIKEVI